MFEKIVAILQEYSGVDKSLIVPDARLTVDLGLNSLDVINIVVAFEDEFGVEISNDDLRTFQCVSDIEEYLEQHATIY
ncbi:acyl carrier protein [Christensenella tenuis]|jgi:acyl carrier protein|uniref:Acyl carrier protein n=1 Tax=Christensenella tenuis TaxID=2763033 RepID=A0ABR7EJQ4_9FIRM|nr:acyl carrier protein [Christensenella tenuis]MBC5649239.1 acyl carrier protein [Christensenella tenuis]